MAKFFSFRFFRVLLLLFFLHSYQITFAQNCSITGIATVCPYDIKTYSFNTTGCSYIPVTYFWSVTGNGSIIGSNTNATVNINWGQSGSGSVILLIVDINNINHSPLPLAVSISTIPNPVITTNVDIECTVYDDEGIAILPAECFQVCELSWATYEVQLNAGSTYIWSSVCGAMNPANNVCTVYWGMAGSSTIQVTEINSAGCAKTVDVCVTKIKKPEVDFSVVPYVDVQNNPFLSICLGQPLYLFDESSTPAYGSPIVGWLWDYGDGNTSALQYPPEHIYANAGSYAVSLTVTNACNCSNTLLFELEVTTDDWVEIVCPTPVCEGQMDTYLTSAQNCDPYNWSVINGSINSTTAYGNSISVVWGSGQNGPGIVSLEGINCSNTTCRNISSVVVPIFSNASTISGNNPACSNTQATYSVPLVPGSFYNWTAALIGGSNLIVSGQNTHQIIVDYTGITGLVTIHCDYTNTFLGCPQATTDLVVDVKPAFTITGETEFCQSRTSPLTYQTNYSGGGSPIFYWKLKKGNGQPVQSWSNQNPLTFTWNPAWGSGTFVLEAQNIQGVFCTSTSSLAINVTAGPPPPNTPSGEQVICIGRSYIYNALPTSTNYYLSWTALNGLPATATGNTVNVAWVGAGPFALNLFQTDYATGCISAPASPALAISKKVEVAPVLNTYSPTACLNSLLPYSIANIPQFNLADMELLEWSVVPATMGSIASGQGTGAVTVQWNNIPGTAELRLKVIMCSVQHVASPYQFPITLVGVPAFTISPVSDCEGKVINFSTSSTVAGATYSWDFGDGTPLGTGAAPTHQYFLFGTNSNAFPISVEITDGNGCSRKESTVINISDGPLANILTNGYCVDALTTVILTALQQSGVSYSYQWCYGSLLNQVGTGLTYTASLAGDYYLIVTDNTSGCASYNFISIGTCIIGGGSGCSYAATLINYSVTPINGNCGEVEINFDFNPAPIDVVVSFGDGTIENISGPGPYSTIHTYAVAGNYAIAFEAHYFGGCATAGRFFEIPVVADFSNLLLSCPDAAHLNQYEIQFNDMSTFYGIGNSIASWIWTDANSPFTSNAQNPSVWLSGGLHYVTLTVTDALLNTCQTTKQVYLPVPLNPLFDWDAPTLSPCTPQIPDKICEKQTVVTFTAQDLTALTYYWDYNDVGANYFKINDGVPGYNTSVRVFEDASQPHNVTLTLTDNYGCTYSSVQTLTANLDQLAIDEDQLFNPANSTICPGSTININYANQNFITNYQWSNGFTTNPTIANATGQYFLTVYNCTAGCEYKVRNVADVREENVPEPKIFGDLVSCFGDLINLTGDVGAGFDYLWTLPPSLLIDPSCAGCTTISPSLILTNPLPTVNTTYSITLQITKTGTTCSRSSTVSITVKAQIPPPVIVTSPAGPLCAGTNINLDITNNAGNVYDVNWSNGMNGNNITVMQANIYEAVFSDAAGCTSANSIIINPLPALDWVINGCFEYCTGDQITIPGGGGPYARWEWFVDGVVYATGNATAVSDFDVNAVLGVLNPGVYEIWLVVTDANSCVNESDHIIITVMTCPCLLNVADITLTCLGTDVNNIAHYGFSLNITYGFPATSNNILIAGANNCMGISLDPITNNTLLTGTIGFDLNCGADAATCFVLTYLDLPSNVNSCTAPFCVVLPDCGNQTDCEFQFDPFEITCAGVDFAGNPIYNVSFDFNPQPNQLTHVFFSSQDFTLSGFTSVIDLGTGMYSGVLTDVPPLETEDGEGCIQLNGYWGPVDAPETCFLRHCFKLPECDGGIGNKIVEGDFIFDKRNANTQLTIKPNPASTSVIINYANLMLANGSISICTVNGNVLAQIKTHGSNGSLHYNISSFDPGVYYIKSGNLVSKMVIIR